jgi:hypothetical protein
MNVEITSWEIATGDNFIAATFGLIMKSAVSGGYNPLKFSNITPTFRETKQEVIRSRRQAEFCFSPKRRCTSIELYCLTSQEEVLSMSALPAERLVACCMAAM